MERIRTHTLTGAALTALPGSRRCGRCPLGLAGPCADCVTRLGPEPLPRRPEGVDRLTALASYNGPAGRLVRSLKFANRRTPAAALGEAMARLVVEGGADPPDVVTWVSTTVARRGRRGFDQARVLAVAVARALRTPCRRLLVRAPGPAQSTLGARRRRQGPPFRARSAAAGSRVLMVDDVVTTGATLAAAARALRSAGASHVTAVVVAATPSGPPSTRVRSAGGSIGSPRGSSSRRARRRADP